MKTSHKNTLLTLSIIIFLILQYLFIGKVLAFSEKISPLVYELFAAVIGSIITVIAMALIMRNQIKEETNKEFASSIFERKLEIYQGLLTQVFAIDDDKIIDEDEIHAFENQIGLACLVANKRLVAKLAQYMYQLKVYGVLYFRNMNSEQLARFTSLVEQEKLKENADKSILCEEKFNLSIPVKGNEIQYFLSLDEFIQGLREDLALIDGDVSNDIEHFVRTPINANQLFQNPNQVG